MKKHLILGFAFFMSACSVVPPYVKPEIPVPATWSPEYPWKAGKPDDDAAKGTWWKLFHDGTLDQLIVASLAQNPDIAIAVARLLQAQSLTKIERAALLPEVNLTGAASRSHPSDNRPSTGPTLPLSVTQNDFSLALSVRYEADVAGRVQATVSKAEASEQQARADLENIRLLMTAELASDYFALRELDEELDVVRQNIALQQQSLEFVSARHELGAATGLDLAQQQAQLDATITEIDLLEKQRATLEHAIAALVGTPAPNFRIAPQPFNLTAPSVPVGLPSDILEHRPDVASAERAMAAANAGIGIAKSAFYPSVILAPAAGLESSSLGMLFNASSFLWSLGLSATQPIFNAGRNRAALENAQAAYTATIENYRKTALAAMQEAQDGLTALAILHRAENHTQQAVNSAENVLTLADARYRGGIGIYLDVITAEQAVLARKRQLTQLRGQQLQSTVFLIKAVGGSWQQE